MKLQVTQHKELDKHRQKGDSLADKLIQSLSIEEVRELTTYLTDYKNLKSIPDKFVSIHGFLEEESVQPPWMEEKQIIRACDFYDKYQMDINIALSCYALPYCYLGAKGAQVLMMTAQIKNNTFERLKQTGFFLQSVLKYDNWKNGLAPRNFLKTRLLHACVRYFIAHHGNWDQADGTPINQEDMAGTNLAFSLIVLRGLRKSGHMLDQSEETAYLHLWKVGAYYLGVHEDLWINKIKEALLLDKAISQRQFESSKAGIDLTHALLDCYHNFTSNQFESEMIIAQTRFMLGDTYADMLKVPKTKVPRTMLKTYNYSSAFLKSMFK